MVSSESVQADDQTISLFKSNRKRRKQCKLVEAYAKANGLWADALLKLHMLELLNLTYLKLQEV